MAPRRFPAVLAASLTCLALAACGADDERDDGASSSGATAGAAAASFEASESGDGKVTLRGPETVEAGAVELELVNAGKGRHDVQLYRVTGDRSPDELIAATVTAGPGKPMPRWAVADGGVGTVQPGERATVTQMLQPGTYYLLDSEQGAGGKPNALRGGIARLEVAGDEGAAELPDAEARITARDYAFETEGLRPGRNRLVFDNAGRQPHHVIAMPLLPGAKPAEVEQFLTSEEPPQGPPPVDFENGVSTAILDGGTAQVADLELAKGRYALVCFIGNREGGPPHAALGMVDTVEVR